ncbi:MAG: peptidyl-prolyl cis-trans isomerase [Nitrospirae bacterium]|nr:peptidyl-prolyl cis-trans isomerase [Nitrospirota bacterium]MBI3594009.1 peptidyl-prolyl cis-trans isomerase [Nitrospirota bacterium]
MKFLTKPFLAILSLAMVFFACPLLAKEILIDRIAAVVNSEPILLSEVEGRLEIERQKESTSLMQLLNQIIDQRLEIQAARKKGLSVTDSEVQAALEETRVRNGLKDEEAFKKSLAKENLTLEKVTEEIKIQLLIRKLFQRDILQDVVIQEKELQAYYQNHLDLFKIPEKREISQILFEWKPDDDGPAREKVKEEAHILYGRLQKGEPIEDLIKEKWNYSRAMTLSELGTFEKGELLSVLDEAAFNTEAGKWSSPVESPLGVHLLRVTQKPAKYRSLDEVSPQIKEKLFQEKSEQLMSEWMANLRKSATIEMPLLKDPSFNNQGARP